MTVATSQDTVAALLERSGRDHLPIRRVFVQKRTRGGGASTLASFVKGHRSTALDLYLLARAVASKKPYDVALPAQVWARALGLRGRGATSVISKNWRWLDGQKLISSTKRGRLREVTILAEDGSGRRYQHPGLDRSAPGDYYKLPYAYWEGNWPNRLGLPAKAMLLIALSLQENFILPVERGAVWYGFSRDTVQRGLSELLRSGILRYRAEQEPAPLAPRGFIVVRYYRLMPPFRELNGLDAGGWMARPTRGLQEAAALPTF